MSASNTENLWDIIIPSTLLGGLRKIEIRLYYLQILQVVRTVPLGSVTLL